MGKKKQCLCSRCRYCYSDAYCPIRDTYIDDKKVYSCEEYFPKPDDEIESNGYSVIEYDSKGRIYYSDDQSI